MARARRSFTKENKAEVVRLLSDQRQEPWRAGAAAGADGDVRAWVKRAVVEVNKRPAGPVDERSARRARGYGAKLKTMTMERNFLRKLRRSLPGAENELLDSSRQRTRTTRGR